jgi:hypothetical protein
VEFANAPITLWLLTTVAVGVISATITQSQSCESEFERDSLQFQKLSDELPERNKPLCRRLASSTNDDEYSNLIESFRNGELFFVYSEFKGKTIYELSFSRSMAS